MFCQIKQVRISLRLQTALSIRIISDSRDNTLLLVVPRYSCFSHPKYPNSKSTGAVHGCLLIGGTVQSGKPSAVVSLGLLYTLQRKRTSNVGVELESWFALANWWKTTRKLNTCVYLRHKVIIFKFLFYINPIIKLQYTVKA